MTADNPLAGLWLWVWYATPSPRETVQRAVDLGVTGILVKGFNGTTGRAPDGYSFIDQYADIVAAAGDDLNIVPWTYVYGPTHSNDPEDEADSFVSAISGVHRPDIFIVDLESEYGSRNPLSRARRGQTTLFRTMQQVAPGRVGCCTFDLPRLHPEINYKGIAPYVDAWYPMVYWDERRVRGSNAIDACVNQHREIEITAPIYPAVQGHGSVTSTEVLRAYGVSGQSLSIWRDGILSEAALDATSSITTAMRAYRSIVGPRRENPGVTAWQRQYEREHQRRIAQLADLGSAIRVMNRSIVVRASDRKTRSSLNATYRGRA